MDRLPQAANLVMGGFDAHPHGACFGAVTSPPQEFAASAVCPESSKYVRALAKLPVSATLPAGGFAAGSMDNEVRVYSLDGTLVRTLAGHSGGVLSLSVCPDGSLVSGSWDGSAKVWNVDTGACTATLGGMENAIAVLAMPNGDIVAGEIGVVAAAADARALPRLSAPFPCPQARPVPRTRRGSTRTTRSACGGTAPSSRRSSSTRRPCGASRPCPRAASCPPPTTGEYCTGG